MEMTLALGCSLLKLENTFKEGEKKSMCMTVSSKVLISYPVFCGLLEIQSNGLYRKIFLKELKIPQNLLVSSVEVRGQLREAHDP